MCHVIWKIIILKNNSVKHKVCKEFIKCILYAKLQEALVPLLKHTINVFARNKYFSFETYRFEICMI